MKRSRLARYFWTATLAVIVAVAAALALAACGGSDTATTETAAPSQSVAAIISSSPTPTPTGTWTPGAKPIPAASIPLQKGTTEGFKSSTNGWEFKPTVDIQVTHLRLLRRQRKRSASSAPSGHLRRSHTEVACEDHRPEEEPTGQGPTASRRWQPVTLTAGMSYVVATVSYPPFDPEVFWPDGADLRARDRIRGLPRDGYRRTRLPADQPVQVHHRQLQVQAALSRFAVGEDREAYGQSRSPRLGVVCPPVSVDG